MQKWNIESKQKIILEPTRKAELINKWKLNVWEFQYRI